MNMGAPLSFATTVSDAQRQLQDALRAGMRSPQQPMSPQPQMPQPQQAMPQMPYPQMPYPQMPQQAMQPQMPQPMPQMAQQAMPQAMPQAMGSAMGSPQMGAPARFAKGGFAVKKATGGAWTRKEGKNAEGGLNAKGRASLKAQGQDIKPPVSAKQAKKSPKSAARRKSFCARSAGQAKMFPNAARDPNSRLNKARRKWDC